MQGVKEGAKLEMTVVRGEGGEGVIDTKFKLNIESLVF